MNDWIEDFPGPGTYQPEKVSAIYHKAAQFTLSGRHQSVEHKQVPGPGQYSPKNAPTVSKAPAYTIRPKLEEKTDTSQPAPNAYSPNFKATSNVQNGGEFSFHGRDTPEYANKTPGPGQYNTEKTLTLGGSGSRRSSISGRNDDCLVPKNLVSNPAPTDYNAKPYITSQRSPAFSLSSRIHENMSEALGKPGPGEYSPSSRSSSVGRPGFSLSGRVKKAHVPE